MILLFNGLDINEYHFREVTKMMERLIFITTPDVWAVWVDEPPEAVAVVALLMVRAVVTVLHNSLRLVD
jgi:hypothetical protein